MSESEDDVLNAKSHSQLLNAIKKFDKTQHIEAPSRSEPALSTNEFSLTKKERGNVDEILKVIEKTKDRKLTSKLRKINDPSRVIPAPLEKPKLERIQRSTAFDESKEKLGRWDAIVTAHRSAEYVSFPIQRNAHRLEPTKTFLSKLKTKSDLEQELDSLEPEQPHEIEDEQERYEMTLEEMKEHRSLLARIRAKESFKAAKFKRQGKIKSKGYHRILRKENLKQQIKEFEELQKTNPEEALRRLNELDQNRAKERHTLRHRNTGKWAKNLQVRAKYDKEAREQLAEQLKISKDLTQKVANSDQSDMSENEQVDEALLLPDNSNPWMLSTGSNGVHKLPRKLIPNAIFNKASSSDEEENNDIAEIETERERAVKKPTGLLNNNKAKAQSTNKNWIVEEVEQQTENLADILEKFEELERDIKKKVHLKTDGLKRNLQKLSKPHIKLSNNDQEKEISLEFKAQKSRPNVDAPLLESSNKHLAKSDYVENMSRTLDVTRLLKEKESIKDNNIDPNKFMNVTPKYLSTSLSNGDHDLDALDDDPESKEKIDISEVFEEDDVIANFRREKQDEIDKAKAKDIDLSLPGWGSWGGGGIKLSKKRKTRFITKKPVEPPRRDENKGDIIIKEFDDKKILAHKVKDLPFPFTSLKDFEASIRAPLGNTFISERAHLKAIKPSVFTKAGTIIEPMCEEDLLIKKKAKLA